MKCYKAAIIFLFFSFYFSTAKAQYYFYNEDYYDNGIIVEVGASIGGINALSDVGGNKGIGKKFIKDLNFKNTQLAAGGYIGVMIGGVFGVRLEGSFGTVKSYDSILKPVAASTFRRYDRNLSFRSSISEFAIIGEFHPLMLGDFIDKEPPLFSPYILAGIGRFSFNPQAFFRGKWVDLEPLRLEGQGFREYPDRTPYHLNATSFPMGLGVRYEAGPLFVLRLEINHRFTSTDYLDDVSKGDYVDPNLFGNYLSGNNLFLATQLYDRRRELNAAYTPLAGEIRGQEKNKDSYLTFSIKAALTLGRQRR